MEKRVLLAAIVSAVFLSWYSNFMMRPAPATARKPASLNPSQQTAAARQREYLQYIEQEEVTFIESQGIRLEIGRTSGAIRRATMKRFTDPATAEPLKFGGAYPVLLVQVGQMPTTVLLVKQEASKAAVEAIDSNGDRYHLFYSIGKDNNVVDIEVSFASDRIGASEAEVVFVSSWTKGDQLSSRYNILEATLVLQNSNRGTSYKRYVTPFKAERIVPRGTFLVSLSERHFCQSLKSSSGAFDDVRLIPSPDGIVSAVSTAKATKAADGTIRYSASAYFGPRDYFRLKKAGFEQAFRIGAIGQIGLILLVALNAIASIASNYGVAIILFSILITALTSPLTLMSVRSMKKMQELKPQMDRIMAQHKNDQVKANQAIFALYREHRVSPLSGCLPILLQMPIFIALFQAMSHFIELRGKGFLWIKDLSLPDRLAQSPLSLPIIGNEINLLPMIMAAAMYVQTRMSQQAAPTAQANPTMKLLSGPLMPVIFCLMFYSFPSGLVLYWLTNTVSSLVLYRLAK
jgi:YidC/Oxa1 family membrane protein insertase